ncbi:MAG: plasmid mobilization relaxosome protein MobC [Chitinophagaceae bacterium]|jgi:hypothetical protein
MEKKTNKIKWLHLRLSDAEYQRLHKNFSATTSRKISEYSRSVLLSKPLIGSYRNKSMDEFMVEMIRLRTELNNIGNNFNQLVKKIHTYKDEQAIYRLLAGYELERRQLLKHIETISLFIEKNSNLW